MRYHQIRQWCCFVACTAGLLAPLSHALAQGKGLSLHNDGESGEKNVEKDIKPLLARYCGQCHSGNKPKAKINLIDAINKVPLRNNDLWLKVIDNIRSGEMPPPNHPRPSSAQATLLINWLELQIKNAEDEGKNDPGRITIRRLNRGEYNNTIRDLVGVDFKPAADFPSDDVGFGFDNIGDVLSLPPILLEKYLAAADQIVTAAFRQADCRKRIMVCEPKEGNHADCAQQIIRKFARRAYRRSVTPTEVNRLARFIDIAKAQGDSFDKGIQLAVQATLVSPHFLFRVEIDPEPNDPTTHHGVGQYELASRLSYFLWSSMPDEELFKKAAENALLKKEILEAEVRRMLKDPKAKALTENFGGQWLQLRNLKTATPDPGQFPEFDDSLRWAMAHETELFFAAILQEDRSILDLLDGPFSFMNDRLARHYGIQGVSGPQFRRVLLKDSIRGGLLTQGSILTVTSNPTRTSPVKRGKWILENILGTPPLPPPPEAGKLSEEKATVLSGPLRQRMEQHRANAVCASCHQRMDPLGFAFENFNAIGAWREKEGQFPIDASGNLPNGASFNGPLELKKILRARKEEFTRCLAEKMMTYALGRGMEPFDRAALSETVNAVAQQNYKFSSLVLAIVESRPFLERRGGKRVTRQ